MSLDLGELENREPDDRDNAGGNGDEPKPRRRRSEAGTRSGDRARSGRRRPEQEHRIREALEAIAAWVRDRGDEELGDVLERDAPKMARVLGSLSNANPAAKRAVAVLADVLEPVRAFGPTLRLVWQRLLERRARRLEELEELGEEFVTPGAVAPAPPEPTEPEVAEPWRIGGGG